MNQDLLISKEFLQTVANERLELTTLSNMARHVSDFEEYIAQLNRMWALVPKDGKAELRKSILNYKSEGNYRGGLAEIVSFWILRKYFSEVRFHPKVGELTPDFAAISENGKCYFETLCVGKDTIERNYDRYFFELQRQLDGYQSKLKISLDGYPIPNAKKNINGLGDAVAQYLGSIDAEKFGKDHLHEVECNGASVAFRIHIWSTEGPVVFSSVGRGASGNPQAAVLRKQLLEKTDKYKFPFTVIAVSDLAVWGPVLTLQELEIDKQPDHLQGTLFASLEQNDGDRFRIKIKLHLADRAGQDLVKGLFPEVPDVRGAGYKDPGLELIP